MKKIIYLILLLPALCLGQAQIGNFLAQKGGVVKHPGYTKYYMPWGAVSTWYIGQELYLDDEVKPALTSEAESFWSTKFSEELNLRPPLSYCIGDGTVSGILPGGSSEAIAAQTAQLLNLLKQNPQAEILAGDSSTVYLYPGE